jgi:hypothetical protein
MNSICLGYANELHAYAYRGVLFLQAIGTNPATGCRNWFQPARDLDGVYDFMRETSGGAFNAVVPFNVVDAAVADDLVEVVIRMEKRGTAVRQTLPVIHAVNEAEASAFAPVLPERTSGKLVAPAGERDLANSFLVHLGTIDIPLGCATMQHPLRSKRMDFLLTVEVALAQDIESAVMSCLKQPTITAALSKLLTPVGWAAGMPLVADAMAACLKVRLSNITRVSVSHLEHCL